MKNKYPLRRDNLVTPWGVGAIVPFPNDESLMVAGLDFWFDEDHSYKDFLIVDDRLTKRLGGKLLVTPPNFVEKKQDAKHGEMKIPAVRFPTWQYCPVCGNMERVGEAGARISCPGDNRRNRSGGTYCSKKIKKGRTPLLVPERFIAVCPKGHIEDFPVMEWVHAKSDKPITDSCKLNRSTGGSSSSLAGIRYTCTCGASATMSGAFGDNALDSINYRCTGKMPWLGQGQSEICGEKLMVLQRGASNVWFADIISSVYIPNIPLYKNEQTKECIDIVINRLKKEDNSKQSEEEIKKILNLFKTTLYPDIDIEQAFNEIKETLSNASKSYEDAQSDEQYRKQEFEVLIQTRGKPSDELYVRNYPINSYDGLTFLKSISLVHKLRETRAFLGFKRISPDSEYSPKISIEKIPWIPAVKNSGEGIMFEFDSHKLDIWAKDADVLDRAKIIENNLRNSKKITTEKLNPVYILLHTFAHCLINALANDSGYSSASIREKIYCSKYISDDMPKMAGILIYTASGDAEGSLGGLVRQGTPGRIENIIKHAVNEAKWCAADPVCIQSEGQGQDGCNLAACHNCALLPETSCENKNMLLDRGLMIGTLDKPSIGYFSCYGD